MVAASEQSEKDFKFFMTIVLSAISTLENFEQK